MLCPLKFQPQTRLEGQPAPRRPPKRELRSEQSWPIAAAPAQGPPAPDTPPGKRRAAGKGPAAVGDALGGICW